MDVYEELNRYTCFSSSCFGQRELSQLKKKDFANHDFFHSMILPSVLSLLQRLWSTYVALHHYSLERLFLPLPKTWILSRCVYHWESALESHRKIAFILRIFCDDDDDDAGLHTNFILYSNLRVQNLIQRPMFTLLCQFQALYDVRD